MLETELAGVLHGIRLVQNRGFRRLIVEVDSSEAFDLLANRRNVNNQLQQLVDAILEIGEDEEMELNWNVVGREFNAVADRLANNSDDIIGADVIYDFVPGIIAQLLSVDKFGPDGPISMR